MKASGDGDKKKLSSAMVFIILFGLVSLFSDMTHEGATSIRGAYYALLGASAGAIGFVSGLGELIGYSLRYFFGRITDRTKKYWPIIIIGYIVDVLAIPALALVGDNGWIAASILLLVQRMGKAIKKPAKDTIMSFAASQEGAGKSFAIQELLDQIGAFLGPLLLYGIMLGKTDISTLDQYRRAFAFMLIPGSITIFMLLLTKTKFPNPEHFEPETKHEEKFKMKKSFIYYIIGISFFAFGFIDYSLIIMHVSKNFTTLSQGLAETSSIISTGSIPLLYSGAMLVDAISALIFGYMYDRNGLRALVISSLISAPFAFFVFGLNNFYGILFGVALWGIGMGAQESILKAAVTSVVPKANRATGYGIFEASFGVFWFLGSWLLGSLYDINITAMIVVSILSQLMAIPFYYKAVKEN